MKYVAMVTDNSASIYTVDRYPSDMGMFRYDPAVLIEHVPLASRQICDALVHDWLGEYIVTIDTTGAFTLIRPAVKRRF